MPSSDRVALLLVARRNRQLDAPGSVARPRTGERSRSCTALGRRGARRGIPSGGSRLSYSAVHVDELDRARLEGAGRWRPVRRTLGLTAIGANAFTADVAGAPLI